MESFFKSKYFWPVLTLAAFCIGAAFGWFYNDDAGLNTSNFKLAFGDKSLELNLDKEEMDSETLLGSVFGKEFSKNGALAWLKLKQKIFHYEDPDIVDEFKNLEPDHPISDELYKLSKSRQGPWAYEVDTIRIGIPGKEYQPRRGFANVCENKKYRGKKLIIYNLDQSTELKIEASGRYPCPGRNFPDIQLNAADADSLLGYSNFSKYEKGIVLIIKD